MITVPTDFPTIQAAINAASPGSIIKVLPGTYTEQITISKSLTIIGSGAKTTIIKAPAVLNPDEIGRHDIVEVNNGAKVIMKGFTINGPSGSSCPLLQGIAVLGDATLNLDSSAVRGCTERAVPVGAPSFLPNGPQVGHATITNTDITNYQVEGIAAFTSGSTVIVLRNNIVKTPGAHEAAGVDLLFGAKGIIVHNKVSGNICNDPACGPDFFNQLQSFGIATVGAAAGTIISNNDVSNNDVGIGVFLNSGCCIISANKLTDNRFFGLIISDSKQTSSNDKISGGNVGVAAIAFSANTVATLVHDTIVGTTTPTQELSCCGFTAKIVTIPPNAFPIAISKSSQIPTHLSLNELRLHGLDNSQKSDITSAAPTIPNLFP